MRSSHALIALLLGAAAACGDNLSPVQDADPGITFDDTIEIDGLTGEVTVFVDDAGVLHIACATDADCFAAEGYFHAAHRFFQMDLRRRLARGRLSEAAGPVALDIDARQRLKHATRDGRPLEVEVWDAIDDDTRAAIEAYTRGVNAWIADLRAREHDAQDADERHYDIIDSTIIDDWDVLDSVAGIFLLADQLTDSSADEIELGDAYLKLGPVVAGDIFTERPAVPTTIAPSTTSAPAPAHQLTPAHRELLATFQPLLLRALDSGLRRPPIDPGMIGSNNWVVGPSRGDGTILLANDTHLGMSNPAVFYLVHLDSANGLHAGGLSFAGLPGIIIGRNDDIAWGLTNTSADFVDVYMETLTTDGSGVVFNGKDVPFAEREETFEISGSAPVTRTLRYVPHHGPVIAGPDVAAGTALSVRWTLNDADTDLNFVLGLMRAGSVTEARAALQNVTTAGQNFVVIDRDGNFGWFPYNRWSERPFAAVFPPWLPLPGTGEAEWGAVIPYDELPQLYNPSQGYIVTANNDFVGALLDGDPTNDGQSVIQWFVALGFRAQRIGQLIAARSDHDLSSMQDIQRDVRSMFGALVVPSILAEASQVTGLSNRAQKVVSALAAWDFECPTGLSSSDPESDPVSDPAVIASSIGCAAFHVLWPRLKQAIFLDELAAAAVERTPPNNSAIHALVDPAAFEGRTYWDNVATAAVTESKQDIVAAALDAAGAALELIYGPSPSDWLWGRIHRLQLAADLFSAFGVTEFDSPSHANDGGFNTVDVAPPRDAESDRFDQVHGPSFRFACAGSVGDPLECTIELPGGNIHHRDDPMYLNLFGEWLTNRPRPFRFSTADVRQDHARAYLLVAPGGP